MSEDLVVRCSGCKKRMSADKVNFVPGRIVYDKDSDMTYPTGKNYCNECFIKFTGESYEVAPGISVIRPAGDSKPPEKEEVKIFKGEMPAYEVAKHKLTGYIERIRHAKAKNGAFYKAVKFRGDGRYFYVWDKNLYENISAGETVEIEFIQTRFPRIVLIKKQHN